MTTYEIRQHYLEYFEKRGHKIIASASLIPENDPTTLFTGSGMQPMVPFLLGEPHPMGNRIVDSQKCFRSQDIDEVGDNRHTTFFEMLGNWSLGDYFKAEQIPWVFEFLTKEIGLDPTRLYVTVFRGNESLGIPRDTEAVELWKNAFKTVDIDANDIDFAERNGMQDGRIFYYDESKNWWSRSGRPQVMPVGEPGGPDSELFWDFGASLGLHENSSFKESLCHVNCDCGRFLEIGNSVFMEYKKTDSGFSLLPKKNVDFGGGLERIAAAVIDTHDIYKIDLFEKMILQLEQMTGKKYEQDPRSFRVILDHARAASFLIGDGVIPSNKDQGYFTRRLIRRAVRFGKNLGINGTFVSEMSTSIIETYSSFFSEIEEKGKVIQEELLKEEEKFLKTLTKGEKEFEKMYDVGNKISGEDAFVLYSTYGFPLELTEEMASEKGQNVNRETFQAEFTKHKNLSRSSSTEKFAGGLSDHSQETIRLHTATHLLLQALRSVLGNHIQQKGSNITQKRLRFDFSHSEKVTDNELKTIQEIVNKSIQDNLPVHFEILSIDEARSRGAVGVFEDKYAQLGGKIKVYFVGETTTEDYFSKEVCGGPHVENTGELGNFIIQKEESVGSGVRRIKAILEKHSK